MAESRSLATFIVAHAPTEPYRARYKHSFWAALKDWRIRATVRLDGCQPPHEEDGERKGGEQEQQVLGTYSQDARDDNGKGCCPSLPNMAFRYLAYPRAAYPTISTGEAKTVSTLS